MRFENTIKVLNDFGKLLVDEYKDNLTLNDVNASNKLYNSISYIIDVKGRTLEVSLSLAEHWKYVEKGRKAGKFPPISAIEEWIRVKPIIPRPNTNGYLPTIKQLSYLIARKIGLDGIKPRPILSKTIEEVFDVMKEFLDEALAKDIVAEWDYIVADFTK